MGYDGVVLRRALNRLKEQREMREAQLEERRQMLYQTIPRLREIDRLLRQSTLQVIAQALRRGSDPTRALDGIRAQNLELQQEEKRLLLQNGYSMDALDETPACRLCGDTGYQGAEPCSCLQRIYTEEQIKELSKLLNLGEQSFEAFSLDVYSDQKWPGKPISPRENMKLIFEICKGYAEKFEKYYFNNLFLSGGTGLGKTFLSACIAKEVSKRGFSVVYDTATNILAQFELQKFARSAEDVNQSRQEVRRYLGCDLLIVDDLGSELLTPFVQSALYTLINSRLSQQFHTVISSNLAPGELQKRYSPAIVSRLLGEYRTLSFFGEDIRQTRNR